MSHRCDNSIGVTNKKPLNSHAIFVAQKTRKTYICLIIVSETVVFIFFQIGPINQSTGLPKYSKVEARFSVSNNDFPTENNRKLLYGLIILHLLLHYYE